MNVKIEFELPLTLVFTEGNEYTLSYGTSTIKAKNIGTSRIDGLSIFDLIPPSIGSLRDYSFNGNKIKEIHLVSALEDHIPGFMGNSIDKKKKKLLEVVMNELNITDRDLMEDGKLESVIREIRLNKILKK
ncbi:MAG: hypothetical protein SLAVMIC_00605 [uncultured marine phage]|uniref:Uncharacterized protein n=1 Tax=uncultured marine phage TaxID=707152 RepID=A0A8D9CAB3_9VIRU|nr:MAG: hypothetical protein SLAVMIC_00605 [uncultured marine phage]